MKPNQNQIEFCDIRRDRSRPGGSGQVIDGLFVFNNQAQRAEQVAYTLGCTQQHIYNLILCGELKGRNIASPSSRRAHYTISRESVLEFMDRRKEGA